jgi:hypothetical protein
MNMDMSQEHPSAVIDRFVRTLSFGTTVEFSSYRYVPQTVRDERSTFKVAARRALREFQRRRQLLDNGLEIAFHSRVRVGLRRRLRHIPMIDFKTTRIDSHHLCALAELREDFGIKEAVYYSSGRSYHMYGLTLLTHDQWLRFMYRLLLLNDDDEVQCVDSRWVAHRLLAGYSALRWTLNTAHYQSVPTLVPQTAFA